MNTTLKKILSLLFSALSLFCQAQYTGTGSVTQGFATTVIPNLYSCTGGRVPATGTITASDSSVWTVPAEVNFTNSNFPFASVLYNSCTGATYPTAAAALAALNGTDIVEVDPGGELITAFIFADNYFELYINGVAVGKDDVPYTQFNSNIVRFRVHRPFTIAMLLVDWEENLGLGSENSNGFLYHAGDGGMVAVFKDSSNAVVAITGNDWKAQTFYTAPITDLACPTENGSLRLSTACSTQDTNNGSAYYGLHWSKPANWMDASFNDASWPDATTYTNAVIGVNNKPAYTNFTNIFDDPVHDAQFIWSTNVILDNEVVVRYRVNSTSSISDPDQRQGELRLYPNPAKGEVRLESVSGEEVHEVSIFNLIGEKVHTAARYSDKLFVGDLPAGIYFVDVKFADHSRTLKLIVE